MINIKKRVIKTDVDFVLLALLILTIPFKLNYSNIFLIIAFIFSLYKLLLKKSIKDLLNFHTLAPLIFFIIVFISAVTSKNVSTGFVEVNKNLLLILIPISLTVLLKKQTYFNKLLLLFSISLTFSTTILLIYNMYKELAGESVNMLFFHEFTRLYDQHPVYYSIYLALSIFIVNDFYFKKVFNRKYNLIVFFIISFILYLGLFFCASKIVIALFVLMNLIQLVILNKRLKFKIIIVSCFVFVSVISLKNEFIKNRFANGLVVRSLNFVPTNDISKAKMFSYEEKKQISDLELRIVFFKIGFFHLIDDSKLFTGYGVGDVQDYLDYYYMTYGLAPNWYERYNLHNQYLQIMVTYGLFVFILFIIYLIVSLYNSIKSKSILYIYFMILILVAFLFESYLVRNKGILFFYTFNTFFLIKLFKDNNKESSI